MARHDIHIHNRRTPRMVFVVLGLGVWLALGLVSQAGFQLLG